MLSSIYLYTILALSGLALSTPTTFARRYYGRYEELAHFDDDDKFAPVVANLPVNKYRRLYYNGFSGVTITGGVQLSGIKPQSPNNAVAYGPLNTATDIQKRPAVTAVYQGSTINSFDLESFWYGCVSGLENDIANYPIPCEIFLEFIDTSGNSVKKQSFDFGANGDRFLQDQIQAKWHMI
ncbi:MAG: hypothetical protein Q9218_005722 [Villophora microphyllina]